METSATEIANYRGNAAAALGSSTNGGASVIYGDTDATRINERLDYVTAQNLAKNKAVYDQKIKDRDDLFEKISSKQMQLNTLLAKDRDLVREKYLKPMRDMLIANPDLKSDPDQYVKFQGLTQDFQEAQNYGTHRYAMVSALDQDIAKEVDPQKKALMEKHRAATEGQGLFEEVKPYQQQLDFSKDIFVEPAAIAEGPTEEVVGDQVFTNVKSRTHLADFVNGVNYNFTDSPNRTLADQMVQYKKSFDQLPDSIKKETLMAWNKKIAEANRDEGLSEGMTGFVPQMSYNKVKDPNGEEHIVVGEPAARIVLAESLLKNYKNATNRTGKISKLPSEIAEQRALAAKNLAGAKVLIPAQAAAAYARAQQSRAATGKLLEETKRIKTAGKKDELDGDFYINSLRNIVDPKNYKDLPTAQLSDQYKELKEPMTKAVMKDGKQVMEPVLGKDGKQMMQVTRVPLSGTVLKGTNAAGDVTSVLSSQELRAMAKRQNFGTSGTGIAPVIPDGVVYNHDNLGNPYYVTMYENKATLKKDAAGKVLPGQDAKVTRTYEIVRPQQILEGLVKNDLGENFAGKESDVIKNLMLRYSQLSGGSQNVNTSIGALTENWNTSNEPVIAQGPKGATKLNLDDERAFQIWARRNKMTSQDYDARGLFKQLDGIDPDDGHKSDKYKLPNHITFSTDSKYSSGKTKGGIWKRDKAGKWAYTPSAFVLSQHSPEELQKYFQENEPDATLQLPKADEQLSKKTTSWFDKFGKK